MDKKFSIDTEIFSELNGNKAQAFFTYLKNVSRNKTGLVLKGVKKEKHWDCNVFECATPTSRFSGIKLPAPLDPNSEGTDLLVSISPKLLQFMQEAGTNFIFGENKVTIRKGTLKLQESYESSQSEIESNLEQFEKTCNQEETPISSFRLEKTSELLKYLENTSNLDATFFIEDGKITYRENSFIFRTPITEEIQGENNIFINVYIATKIKNILTYCDTVDVEFTDTHTILKGKIEGNEIVRNVSSIFEATDDNPSDEDLQSILPTEETGAESVVLDSAEFFQVIGEYLRSVQNFMDIKKPMLHLYKNGNGLSIKLNADAGEDRFASFNIGAVAEEEPDPEKFSIWNTELPINTLKNIIDGGVSITFEFDNSEDTVVLIKSGEKTCLSGKAF
jgi:hypothetical protein